MCYVLYNGLDFNKGDANHEHIKKRFKMARFRFETDTGGYIDRHMSTGNFLPVLKINQWIETKCLRKPATGRDCASKLVIFLNHLNKLKVEYQYADNRHVQDFIRSLIYGDMATLTINDPETIVSYSILTKYITVITGFYRWLDNDTGTNMSFASKPNVIHAQKSFLYGQMYTHEYSYLADSVLPHLSSKRTYTKWYAQEEKLSIGKLMSLTLEIPVLSKVAAIFRAYRKSILCDSQTTFLMVQFNQKLWL